MIVAFFLLTCVLLTAVVMAVQHLRARRVDPLAAATLFETREDPPFLRPVVSRHVDGHLVLDAPIVHARLVNGILVLDVKSNAAGRAEGFEVAVTGFDASWLEASGYGYVEPAEAYVLVGPQGAPTDHLLRRVARSHDVKLPASAGAHVQAFEVISVVVDPAEFRVKVEAQLPGGETFAVAYDYAAGMLRGEVAAAVFAEGSNAQRLAVRLDAVA